MCWNLRLFRPHCAKACLLAYANSKGPDQPAHVYSLIRAFCCLLTELLDTTEYKNGEKWPVSYFVHAQKDLNRCILRMFEGTFWLDEAQFCIGFISLLTAIRLHHCPTSSGSIS